LRNYSVDHIEEREVGRTCETYSGGKNFMQGFNGRSELKTILEKVGADGNVNIKMELK